MSAAVGQLLIQLSQEDPGLHQDSPLLPPLLLLPPLPPLAAFSPLLEV